MKLSRYFVRVANNRVALGSLMMRAHRPSGSGWVEVPASALGLCCISDATGGGLPPLGFTATAGSPSATVTTLAWSAKAGATGYVLERSLAADFSNSTTIYSGTALTYSNTGLTTGTAYFYRLHAGTPNGNTEPAYATRTPA